MLLSDAQAHLEIMLEQRTRFEDIEAFIENVALPAERCRCALAVRVG
jgi:hypothetical protein